MRLLHPALLLSLLWLSSCASPTAYRTSSSTQQSLTFGESIEITPALAENPIKTSLRQSRYGHRPGPRGFDTVIIDAGHGGKDSGAINRRRSLQEKKLALDTAQKLQAKLSPTFRTVFIRDHDKFVELDDRVKLANQYSSAILVSIHYNHGSSALRGPETYYWRVDSYSLAKRMQKAMKAVSPRENSRELVRRRLRLTRNPYIPSVLVECGYLSNSRDAKLISKESYRDKMASALAKAIKDQAKKGDSGMGPLPRPINKPLSKSSDPPGS